MQGDTVLAARASCLYGNAMRIVNGHDYYDSALSFGHDPNLVYVRGDATISAANAVKLGIEPSFIPLNIQKRSDGSRAQKSSASRPRPLFWRRSRVGTTVFADGNMRWSFAYPTVIACGVRYQGIHAVNFGISREPDEQKSVYFWTAQQFKDWLDKQEFELITPSHKEIQAYFEPTPLPNDARDLLVDRRWTILVHDPHVSSTGWYTETEWMIDQPVLHKVQFYKAVPPNNMFQEIEMWIGGVLPAKGADTVEISDEVRLVKHGFDRVASFRRPKTKRR